MADVTNGRLIVFTKPGTAVLEPTWPKREHARVGANSFALPINACIGTNIHRPQVNSTLPWRNISDNKILVATISF